MKKKQFKPFVLLLTAILLNAYHIEVNAQSSSLLTLQANRSSGYTVKNETGETLDISATTLLTLAGHGRVWFKSPEVGEDNALTLICQNNSSEDVVLEFNAPQWPWLNQSIYSACSGWVNHKLVCQIGKNAKDVLSCGMLKRGDNPFSSGKIERRTSITMRSLPAIKKAEDQMLEEIKTELQLCKKVSGYPASIDLFWKVENGKYHYLEVMLDDTPEFRSLAECFDSVLKQHSFESFSGEQQFDLSL